MRSSFAPPVSRTGTTPDGVAELEPDPVGSTRELERSAGRSPSGRRAAFDIPPWISTVHGIVGFSAMMAPRLRQSMISRMPSR